MKDIRDDEFRVIGKPSPSSVGGGGKKMPTRLISILSLLLVLGIGCRRGTPYKKIRKALTKFLHEKGYNEAAIDVITSVDIKADEKGLIELSRNMNVPFYTYDPDQLRRISSKYTASAFVAAVTGTPSVAEAAALIHAKGGFTIVPKTVVDGITFSLAEVPTKIKI